QRLRRRAARGGAGARRGVSLAQVGLDRRPLPFLRRPPRLREGLRVLRRHGQDVYQDEGPGLPQEGDRLLREDPDRRHARRLHPAGRRAATADRPRSPRDGVRLRRHAARAGRAEHAALRQARDAGAAAGPDVRRADQRRAVERGGRRGGDGDLRARVMGETHGEERGMAMYWKEITVNWGESDPFGLVYYPRIVAWFSEGRATRVYARIMEDGSLKAKVIPAEMLSAIRELGDLKHLGGNSGGPKKMPASS